MRREKENDATHCFQLQSRDSTKFEDPKAGETWYVLNPLYFIRFCRCTLHLSLAVFLAVPKLRLVNPLVYEIGQIFRDIPNEKRRDNGNDSKCQASQVNDPETRFIRRHCPFIQGCKNRAIHSRDAVECLRGAHCSSVEETWETALGESCSSRIRGDVLWQNCGEPVRVNRNIDTHYELYQSKEYDIRNMNHMRNLRAMVPVTARMEAKNP